MSTQVLQENLNDLIAYFKITDINQAINDTSKVLEGVILDISPEADRITQWQLAERMNCSQQYISKILKGCENLSLKPWQK